MIKHNKYLCFIVYLVISLGLNSSVFAQHIEQDSINSIISKTKDDSVLIIHLKNLSKIIKNDGNELLTFDEYEKIIEVCKKNLQKNERKHYYAKELVYSKIRIASIYTNSGNYAASSTTLLDALKIAQEMQLKELEAEICNGIGSINYTFNYFETALDYFNKSLKINIEINDRIREAELYNNIGNVYVKNKDTLTGISYFEKSLKIVKDEDFKFGLAALLNNLGGIYLKNITTLEKGKQYLDECYKVRLEINDQRGMPSCLINISNYYIFKENYKLALKYAQEAYLIASKTNHLFSLERSTNQLYKIYKHNNQYYDALLNFELFKKYNDSIHNKDAINELSNQKLKLEFFKKTYIDSLNFAKVREIKDIEIKKQQAEIKSKRKQQIALSIGLVLVIIFAGLIYNRFKITQIQKAIIEEKNKEITDSITYAKRIQNAILPPTKLVKEYLPESFILYKPKDIIAGDFYWMEAPSSKERTIILFAAADCTGHGVPGAMVSVVCNNALNRSVREYGLTNPAEILNKTREIVIQEFEKSNEDVKDGMDISLCGLDLNNNMLSWSGANNPLWIIRPTVIASATKQSLKNEQPASLPKVTPSEETFELIEYKPDKQPIGNYTELKPFTTHTINLKKGDTIYIFTDGFADQFGGPKGKKLMYKPFKELLLSIQDKTLDEQKEILAQHFDTWKGKLEQVDDVCIIGVRIC